ncbi:MAG: hypothetical protein WBS14_10700 [Rhodomicrobium sp.]
MPPFTRCWINVLACLSAFKTLAVSRTSVCSLGAAKAQDLSFAARVSLDRKTMQIDNRRVNLTPGMAVTVEVNTGRRRITSYLLSPLMKYTHDSIRER